MLCARPLERQKRGWCPHAAYLEDGGVISAQKSHVNFIVRALYGVILYFILQLPEAYGVRVDLDTFFAAFSMLNEQNERVRIQPWSSGPGYRYVTDNAMEMSTDEHDATRQEEFLDESRFVNQDNVRAPLIARWDKYYRHVASHIPYAVCKSTPDVELIDNDDTGLESTLKHKNTQNRPRAAPPVQTSGSGGRPESTCAQQRLRNLQATNIWHRLKQNAWQKWQEEQQRQVLFEPYVHMSPRKYFR